MSLDSLATNGFESLPVKAWRVGNFKSISEAHLNLAPLTVLVGPNSAGKTSLIQTILLVVQAAQAGNQGSTFPLNGSIVSVGEFDQVRFAHSKGGSIGIGATLQLSPEAVPGLASTTTETTPVSRSSLYGAHSILEWWAAFDAPAVNEPGSAEIASVELGVEQLDQDLDAVTRLKLSSSRRGQGPVEADVERQRLGSLALPTRDEFSLGYIGELSAGDAPPLGIRGLLLRAGLPHKVLSSWRLGDAAATVWAESRLVRPFWTASRGIGIEPRGSTGPRGSEADDATVEHWAGIAAQEIREWDRLRATEPVTLPAFLARSRRPLPPEARTALRHRVDELVDAIQQKLDMDDEVFLPPQQAVTGWLNDVVSDVHRFFRERVVYLGPLRQDPQLVYKTAPVGAAGFIGTKGEYLATVLHASRAREVMSFREDGTPERVSLSEAVNRWSARLEIADSIQTRDLGRIGIQVSVQRGGIPPVDLTSVGVGVSQLLPVMVMCLLAEAGSLILLEQPELHLHPALQQRLGDFLLACARSGRQLIVETHSEYLVSRLRRRIAEDESGRLLDALALYFVEQRDDASEFRGVAVNEFGGLTEWPAGFFDQAATESRRILEAGLQKRSQQLG